MIPAGWVLDRLELKGKIIGGAKVSLEHANFVVNTGKATSVDVITLISHIKKRAKEELNLEMEEEIQYLGFKYSETGNRRPVTSDS
jgi:UDP-N-acetylmuramate dehydrogenase